MADAESPLEYTPAEETLNQRWDDFRDEVRPLIKQINAIRPRYPEPDFALSIRWLTLVRNQLLMLAAVDNPCVLELGDFIVGIVMPLLQCGVAGSKETADMEEETGLHGKTASRTTRAPGYELCERCWFFHPCPDAHPEGFRKVEPAEPGPIGLLGTEGAPHG